MLVAVTKEVSFKVEPASMLLAVVKGFLTSGASLHVAGSFDRSFLTSGARLHVAGSYDRSFLTSGASLHFISVAIIIGHSCSATTRFCVPMIHIVIHTIAACSVNRFTQWRWLLIFSWKVKMQPNKCLAYFTSFRYTSAVYDITS